MTLDPGLEIAWAAGFIEGEGHVRERDRRLDIEVPQNAREPLERLQSLFGGEIYEQRIRNADGSPRYASVHPNRKNYWRWKINRQADIRSTLEAILPHLSEPKKSRVHAVLAAKQRREDERGVLQLW